MAFSPDAIGKHFEEIEKVAEEVISDKQEIISLDKRRNTNREALRQLNTSLHCNETSKIWTCIGNMFIRLPQKNVIGNIEKEQEKLNSEINNLRNGLRGKVDQLNELEGKPLTRGSGLKALSSDEWKAVKQVVGH